jgi:septum formation protein
MVLASKSPRRQALLEKYISDFIIEESGIEEVMDDQMDPSALAMSLAYQKAADVQTRRSKDDLILAADTIVVADRVLGKPRSRDEARDMIASLAGKSHEVITGIALLRGETKVVDFQTTRVIFAPMTAEDIENYLDRGDYMDKAGAYGIQGFAEPFIQEMQGSYSNVVGLPVERLYAILREYFDVDLIKGMADSDERE